MKRFSYRFALLTLFTFCLALSPAVLAQQPASPSASKIITTGAPPDVDRIIRAFTAKESEFRQALNNYAFQRDAVIQTVGMGGQISGEYRRTSIFTFDDQGTRFEKITFFPMPTLVTLQVTQEDLEDLGGIQPFALESSKFNLYKFTYVGRERIDELNTYVFDVNPKIMPTSKKPGDRMFQGRIWVDDRDLQIVKVRGKGVPEGKQRFPTFETYREHIDGRYWFPTYTYADEELVFSDGTVIHFRMRVRYTDYKRFRSEVKVTEVEEGEN
jgi:muconolactone delta-isomerase